MKTPIVFATTAIALACASPAYADESSYLVDLQKVGFEDDDGNGKAIAAGYQICSDIQAGTSESDEAHMVWMKSGISTLDHAAKFVTIALRDLCPGALA